jgi:MFS family permease
MNRWVVFGTLLGPEATGPGGVTFPGLVCFWFPGCTDHAWWLFLWGRLVCGVCGTGLLFENYIVDASIFYKKQFPRI